MLATISPLLILRVGLVVYVAVTIPSGQDSAPSKTAGPSAPVHLTATQDHQRMMDLLRISALRPGADGNHPEAPNAANYDESKANPYPKLPDPLVLYLHRSAISPADAGKRAAAMFLQVGVDVFIVAGAGNLTITFSPNVPGPAIAGIASMDEQVLEDGHWTQGRRLNGDENGQGQVLRLEGSRSPVILRVKLYPYR